MLTAHGQMVYRRHNCLGSVLRAAPSRGIIFILRRGHLAHVQLAGTWSLDVVIVSNRM